VKAPPKKKWPPRARLVDYEKQRPFTLWFLFIYVYAIAGQEIFGKNDPTSFGKLRYPLWALFGAPTPDGVGGLMPTQIRGCDKYGSYIEYPYSQNSSSLGKPFCRITTES
jgi:hypothetical protein